MKKARAPIRDMESADVDSLMDEFKESCSDLDGFYCMIMAEFTDQDKEIPPGQIAALTKKFQRVEQALRVFREETGV